MYYLLKCIKFLVRKNKTLKKYWKMEKNTGKVREFCQPGKVGTLHVHNLLPPATNFRQGNFLTPVCHSFHGRSLSKGVFVHGGFLSMGLSVSRGGVCVQGGSLSGEGLCPGRRGGLCQGDPAVR